MPIPSTPWKTWEDINPDVSPVGGWSSHQDREWFFHLFESMPYSLTPTGSDLPAEGGTFIEVGVYLGGNLFLALATAVAQGVTRRIIGVDNWFGDGAWTGEAMRLKALSFLGEVDARLKARFPDKWTPQSRNMVKFVTSDSLAAAQDWKYGSAELVHVDGDHAYAAQLADIRAWSHHVKLGGILAIDDCSFSQVQQAVEVWLLDGGVREKWQEIPGAREADVSMYPSHRARECSCTTDSRFFRRVV